MKPIWQRLNVEMLLTQLVGWVPSLLAAILMLVVFWALFRVTRKAFSQLLMRAGFEPALAGMVLNVYRFTLLTFGIVTAASQLGINVSAALAGLGVVGLTIGFAAKDTLSNIMAGFLIFWDKPFRVDEWISVGGHYGKVAEITMRTTRLCTRNNTWVILPNETVINQVLVNHSANGRTRLEVPVGIAYKEDVAEARRVLVEAVRRVPGVLEDPPPHVVVNKLGPSSVDLLVQAWIPDAAEESPTSQKLLEAAKAALDAAGIQIPFPHLQLFVDAVKEDVWAGAAALGQGAGGRA
jgi:small conductance mechanosensitive channel